MASHNTNRGARDILNGNIDLLTDTIKARLLASSFTPNKDDTTMTGHTAIGTDQTVASKAVAEDTTNDIATFTGAVLTWTAVAGGSTIGWVEFFKFVTNDAGSTPIAVVDVTDTPTNGSDITFTAHATNKFFYLQQ